MSEEGGGGRPIGERLADIAGDIRLILAAQGRYEVDVRDIKERAHGHANRIAALEAAEHVRQGERRGIATSAKMAYLVIGGGGVSTVIAVLAFIWQIRG